MGRRILDLRAHVEARVDKTSSPDGCWLWTASASGGARGGYGIVRFQDVQYRVHRLVLEWAAGPPTPEKSVACHTCDTRRCVRPSHLYWGDAFTNAQDAVKRGRHGGIKQRGVPKATLPTDLIGQRFGALTALEPMRQHVPKYGTRWLCACDCGATKIVRDTHLRHARPVNEPVQRCLSATHDANVQHAHNVHVERTELFPYVDHDFHVSARCSRCGHSSHAHEGQGCLNCLCVAFLPVEPASMVAEDCT